MSNLKLFILLGFVIMFVAGLTIGRSYPGATVTAVAPTVKPTGVSTFPTLDEELKLSPTQRQQWEKIWKDTHAKTDLLSRQFRELDDVRDKEIQSMLDPDQYQSYIAIQHERDEHLTTLKNQISTTMKSAQQAMRALLTPDQQKKFDDAIKHGGPRHGPPGPKMMGPGGGPPHMHHHGGPETGPASFPDAAPVK